MIQHSGWGYVGEGEGEKDTLYNYGTRQKEQQFIKFVRCFLIRNRATLLWFVREVQDTELRRFLPNAPQFGGLAAFSRRKVLQSGKSRRNLCFTRRHTVARPSKCGTFGGRKAACMQPCFQVPLRHVCCILFDAYRICMQRTTRVLHVTKYTITMNVCSAPSDDTAKCNCVCLLHFPEYGAQLVYSQGAYQNDHQPSLNRMVVLKVNDIASRETEGRVYTDDLENTLGYAFLQTSQV